MVIMGYVLKEKITLKKMRTFDVVSVGYCEMQHLLRNKQEQYYSAGVCGWNCDLYVLDNIAICTGYRAIKGDYKVDHDLLRKYEDMARKILSDYGTGYERKLQKVDKLLNKAIKECFSK